MGVPMSALRLISWREVLDDEKAISHYPNIMDADVPGVLVALKEYTVNLKTLADGEFTETPLAVKMGTTIARIKDQYYETQTGPPRNQRFIFRGKELSEIFDEQSLADRGIVPKTTNLVPTIHIIRGRRQTTCHAL